MRPMASTAQRVPIRRDRGTRAFEIPSMLPLLSSPLESVCLPLHAGGAAAQGSDRSGSFLWRWTPSSPTTFYPCGRPPVTACSRRLSTRAGSPGGGDPISTTAFLPGPELPRATSTSTPIAGGLHPAKRLRRCEDGSLREAPCREASPPRKASLPSDCPHAHTPQARATVLDALSPPVPPGTLRLLIPPSRPPLGAARARAGGPTWACLVPAPSHPGEMASALRPPSRPPPDASAPPAHPTMPCPPTRPP